MANDNIKNKIHYFIPGPQQEADKRLSTEIIQ